MVAAACCSARRMPGMADLGTAGSKPPESPSLSTPYVTAMPALVQQATVPPAQKSTSSGWATTTSARSISLSARTTITPVRWRDSSNLIDGSNATVGCRLATAPAPRDVRGGGLAGSGVSGQPAVGTPPDDRRAQSDQP